MSVEHEEPVGKIILAVSDQIPSGASAVMTGNTEDIKTGEQLVTGLNTIYENCGSLADDFITAGVVLAEVQNGNDVVILVSSDEDAADLEETINST
jgi:hypothetical protein